MGLHANALGQPGGIKEEFYKPYATPTQHPLTSDPKIRLFSVTNMSLYILYRNLYVCVIIVRRSCALRRAGGATPTEFLRISYNIE